MLLHVSSFEVLSHLDNDHFPLCLYLKLPIWQMFLDTHFIPSISAVGQASCQMDSQLGQKVKMALAEDSLQKCQSALKSFNLTQDHLDTYKYLVQKLQSLLACDRNFSIK